MSRPCAAPWAACRRLDRPRPAAPRRATRPSRARSSASGSRVPQFNWAARSMIRRYATAPVLIGEGRDRGSQRHLLLGRDRQDHKSESCRVDRRRATMTPAPITAENNNTMPPSTRSTTSMSEPAIRIPARAAPPRRRPGTSDAAAARRSGRGGDESCAGSNSRSRSNSPGRPGLRGVRLPNGSRRSRTARRVRWPRRSPIEAELIQTTD